MIDDEVIITVCEFNRRYGSAVATCVCLGPARVFFSVCDFMRKPMGCAVNVS